MWLLGVSVAPPDKGRRQKAAVLRLQESLKAPELHFLVAPAGKLCQSHHHHHHHDHHHHQRQRQGLRQRGHPAAEGRPSGRHYSREFFLVRDQTRRKDSEGKLDREVGTCV